MRRDDSAILLDIAHAAALVAKFMKDKQKTTFLDDELTQSAVLHQILVLRRGGEAALSGVPFPLPRRAVVGHGRHA